MKTKSSEERAYWEVLEMIVSQKYPPGSSLTEQQLSDELKMSRTPIRHALRRLVADGLLDNPTNKSCSIPVLTRRDLEDLFRVRLLIEPAAARDAALRVDETQRDAFFELVEQEKRYGLDPTIRIHEINEEIHFGIAALSGNDYFQRSLKQLFWRSQLYLFFFDTLFYTKPEGGACFEPGKSRVKSTLEHEELLEAVFGRNPDRAECVMRRHVESTHAMLTRDDRG